MDLTLSYRVINIVVSCNLGITIDRNKLVSNGSHIIKNKHMPSVIWRHKTIPGTAMIFTSGYMSIHGCKQINQAVLSIRKYARLIS